MDDLFDNIVLFGIIAGIVFAIVNSICKYIKDRVLIEKYRANVYEQTQKFVNDQKQALIQLVNDTSIQLPFLADAFADFLYLQDQKISQHLIQKSRPAIKAAEQVSQISRDKRMLQKGYRLLKYQLSIYEKVFPWLEEFKEISISDLANLVQSPNDNKADEYDLVKKYLSPDEYSKLTSRQKYQLALDRYRNYPNKSKWEIGIEFERYVGYLFEKSGFKVKYSGAIDGLSDLGRDIIASRNNLIVVVQCKYWRKERIVHEKHIFQLYGSMLALQIDNPSKKVKGRFYTTTTLSDTAKIYASKLGISVDENADFDKNYPCIKCNISKTGEKIYHLPFDQQYDRVIIDYDKGECYASTIDEAENLGFRRAFRWQGDKSE